MRRRWDFSFNLCVCEYLYMYVIHTNVHRVYYVYIHIIHTNVYRVHYVSVHVICTNVVEHITCVCMLSAPMYIGCIM